jgi:hypothetical protein
MSEPDYVLTPFAVATKALGAEQWAEDVLGALGKSARLGAKPGEIGVIVFSADGPAAFDVAQATEVPASGDAAAPRFTERDAGGAETVLHEPPVPPPTWDTFRAMLAERFANAERTVALHLERGIYEPRTAEAVLHDVACALGGHDEEIIHELFPAVAERAAAKAVPVERTALDQLEHEEGGA